MENVNKYNNSRVYKIWTTLGEEVYYGSTYDTLKGRFSKHKASYKGWLKGTQKRITCYDLFEKYGIEHCLIELVEPVNCNSKQELAVFEARHIRDNNCVNKNIPSRTKQEYYNDNITERLEYQKQYYDAHKEQKKEYYEANRDKIADYQKQYRLKKKNQNDPQCS